VTWSEVDSLYGRGPRERIFASRRSDDGSTTLTFGDGRSGARLPGGYENIRATYRKGIGLEGLVTADKLTILLPPPLGIKAVINPAPTTGAQDPEDLASAKQNAPMQVLTFGRIVGLKDYEDFARTFSGIAKAHATWTWSATGRGVFITVAAPEGNELSDDLINTLKKALLEFGNPLVPIVIKSAPVAKFSLAGTLFVERDRLLEKVKGAVDQALLAAFNFDSAAFGRAIALSEIFALIESVPGVASVDIDQLTYVGRANPPEQPNHLLTALRPRPGVAVDSAIAAELLVLDPGSLANLPARFP
jgi:predicted phage baseplate assembly protein